LCEMGRQADWDGFDAFVKAVTGSPLEHEDLEVRYTSPSLGPVRFSWDGPLVVTEQQISLHNTPRFDNPYCHVPFARALSASLPRPVNLPRPASPMHFTIQRQGETLEIEF
ncbi:MAG: hypothetical protein J7M39_14095, partial [Anaerolineae bacterium]|nr:hypothetical protein [Anaerolineae bacterium]